MANKILDKKKDKSFRLALKEALKDDGKISFMETIKILISTLDGNVVTDVEYRDLKRLLREQKSLSYVSRITIHGFISRVYPLRGPFVHSNVDSLNNSRRVGNQQCAAIVQATLNPGLASTWREGAQVRGNAQIKKGTAVATFVDGFYPNKSSGNHVAFYLSQDASGIRVMDQWLAANKPRISSRVMKFKGKNASGLFVDPSNNGDALSVIMRKA